MEIPQNITSVYDISMIATRRSGEGLFANGKTHFFDTANAAWEKGSRANLPHGSPPSSTSPPHVIVFVIVFVFFFSFSASTGDAIHRNIT